MIAASLGRTVRPFGFCREGLVEGRRTNPFLPHSRSAGRNAGRQRPGQGQENVEHRHRGPTHLPHHFTLETHDRCPLPEALEKRRVPGLQAPRVPGEQDHRAGGHCRFPSRVMLLLCSLYLSNFAVAAFR